MFDQNELYHGVPAAFCDQYVAKVRKNISNCGRVSVGPDGHFSLVSSKIVSYFTKNLIKT